jgi:DNA-binding response OmpR family regulator
MRGIAMSVQANHQLPLVLIAHHARDTVDLLKALLEREGYTTLCVYTGRAALQYARQHHPALLLLDQRLPLLDGLELCRTLRQDGDEAAIFILGEQADEFGRLVAFAAGADDCLSLPFHPRELLARAKAALRRAEPRANSKHPVLRCGAIELDPALRQVQVNGKPVILTILEYELLSLLIRNAGRAFSRAQLLDHLHSLDHGIPFDRSVDIHVSNLRRKLHQPPGSDTPIETVRGLGYRLNAQPVKAPSPERSNGGDTGRGKLALEAFEHIPVPLLVLAADRTVALYNEEARRLCGWSAEQVVDQVKCYSLFSCHDNSGSLLCYDRCTLRVMRAQSLHEQTARYMITLKDGSELPVDAHYISLGDSDREYTLLVLKSPTPASQDTVPSQTMLPPEENNLPL